MTDGISQGIADEGARADRAALKLLKENNAQLRADNERLRGQRDGLEVLCTLAEMMFSSIQIVENDGCADFITPEYMHDCRHTFTDGLRYFSPDWGAGKGMTIPQAVEWLKARAAVEGGK